MNGQALVYARAPLAARVLEVLPIPGVRVENAAALMRSIYKGRPGVLFVEYDRLPELEASVFTLPVIALVDGHLPTAIDLLATYPNLSHFVAETLFSLPRAKTHLAQLVERIGNGIDYVMMTQAAVGRTALLASSERRESRFDRMREYLAGHDIGTRQVGVATDVAEELVTNALYDAPTEARYFPRPVPRTEHVTLPPDRACEISYGIDDGGMFVRVRDPFGALSRDRMLSVLTRCSAGNVSIDESRGGAGLGLWRVFSLASAMTINVIPGRLTDIVVRLETGKQRGARTIFGIHLFFPPKVALDGAQSRFAADHDSDLLDESFTQMHL